MVLHTLIPEFLAELLAGADAREDDLNIPARFQPGETDQVLCQVQDADLFAHAQHEELGATPHGRRLENQVNRLGDGHEIASHLRMGDGHRPAAGNLALEERDDAAAAAKHIAKSYRDERRPLRSEASRTIISAMRFVAPIRLAGWTALSVEISTSRSVPRPEPPRQRLRPEDIVRHGFLDIQLHEGHVLVGRGVEDDLRPEVIEDGSYPARIADIGNDRQERQAVAVLRQVHHRLEYAVLTVAKQRQLGRPPASHLPAQFQADRPSGAGDQNAFPGQRLADCLVVDMGRLAAQQVTDLDLAQASSR